MTDSDSLSNRGAGEPSSSLLHRVRECNQAAWERLVSLYSPLVYYWCRQCQLQPADAADVGQQVFLAIARQVHDYRPDPTGGSFRAWLRTLTRYAVNDHLRTIQIRGVGGVNGDLVEQPSEAAGKELAESSGEAEQTEQSLLFHRAMNLMQAEFEERTWLAFWHVVVDGRSPADVAQDLGMTRNAVYLAHARVLLRLREEFGDLVDM